MVKKWNKYFFVLIILFTLTACNKPNINEGAYDDIVVQEQAFMRAFEQQDANQLANLYSEEAQLLPIYRPFVETKAEIARFWRGLMTLGIASVKLETLEVESYGDNAHEVGRYTIHLSDGDMIDFGKYVVIWKKESDQWLLHRHIWTTSMIKANESRI